MPIPAVNQVRRGPGILTLISLFILSLAVPAITAAETVENLELMTCLPGYGNEIAVEGDVICAATYTGLLILDGSDPNHPRKLSFLPMEGFGVAVAVRDGYAYFSSSNFFPLTGPGGLTVIDISHPDKPLIVGVCEIPSRPDKIVLHGDYAYVAESYEGIHVIDISDPHNPEAVHFIDIYNPGRRVSMEVADDLLYVTLSQGALLLIYDMGNPLSPVEIGSLGSMGGILGLKVRGGYAYIAGGSSGLWVVDVSDPTAPAPHGRCTMDYDLAYGAFPFDVALVGDYAFLSIANDGIGVVDISDPADPLEVGYHEIPGSARTLEIADDIAYVAAGYGGVCLVDVDDPANLNDFSHYRTVGDVNDMALADDRLYVNGGYVDPGEKSGDGSRSYYSWAGLYIFDFMNPTNPVFDGFRTTYYPVPSGVAVNDEIAYVTTFANEVFAIDAHDPSDPFELDLLDSSLAETRDIAIQGDLAYIGGSHYGLIIVDISNPAKLVEIGTYDEVISFLNIDVQGDYVYASSYSESLTIIDVSDPENPRKVSTLEIDNRCRDIEVAGDLLYLANTVLGLCVIDVGDPAAPEWVGNLAVAEGYPEHLAVEGGYAYLAGTYGCGLRVIDVSDPANPSEVAFSDLPGDCTSILVDERRVCIGAMYEGIWIFEHTTLTGIDPLPGMPDYHVLGRNFPNPFNPTTTIEFNLPRESKICLEIFDVRGRLVRTLVNGVVAGGDRSVDWDGRDNSKRELSSGLYLYRLETDSFTETRSMVLMK
ncbi:MAG: T9SS type A sorting domain-containing protein [bacterium]|nr:T9SS type A sorting domain-containing protein [bacterium]